jgi:hypothetical protein
MKLSQLKQLIKEEIQNEASIMYGNNFNDFKKMLELDKNTNMPIIDDFIQWVDFNEWKEESYYDEDDDSPEAKEKVRLASVFFNLRKNNLISPWFAEVSDEPNFISLPKAYKNMVTYGDGVEYVRIILTAF